MKRDVKEVEKRVDGTREGGGGGGGRHHEKKKYINASGKEEDEGSSRIHTCFSKPVLLLQMNFY